MPNRRDCVAGVLGGNASLCVSYVVYLFFVCVLRYDVRAYMCELDLIWARVFYAIYAHGQQ